VVWKDVLQRQAVIELMEGVQSKYNPSYVADHARTKWQDRVRHGGRTERWILGFSICRLQQASRFYERRRVTKVAQVLHSSAFTSLRRQ
jgi:hypothetical protein